MTAKGAVGSTLDQETDEGSALLLGSLVLMVLTTAVVSSLGAPLIPSVPSQFDISLRSAQWSQAITLLVSAVIVLIAGRLGTGTRRRPVVLTGLEIVGLGLLLDVHAPSSGALVTGRALQGVVPLPSTRSCAFSATVPERRSVSRCSISSAKDTRQNAASPSHFWSRRVGLVFAAVLALVLQPRNPRLIRNES